ncbi:MAG: carboxypeptidase-like regulatory domain-containing protein [Thermosynechococcaceae cyanobacterium]
MNTWTILGPLVSALSVVSMSMAIACQPPANTMSSNTVNSGIQGKVLMGPACPVMRVDRPCPDRPYSAKLAIVNERGEVVSQIDSDAAGSFAVKLPPGTYTVKSAQEGVMPFMKEQPSVTVAPDQMAEVTLHFDSGMR